MSNTQSIEQEIHSLEGRRYQAMVDADVGVLQQLLGDALIYTHSSGAVDGQTSYLEGVAAKKFVYRNIERRQE